MTQAQLVDSHCHLDFSDFDDELDAVIDRAAQAGVTRMVTICTRLRQLPKVQAIAEAHDGVFFAAGGHPLHVHEEPEIAVEELCAIAAHPNLRDRLKTASGASGAGAADTVNKVAAYMCPGGISDQTRAAAEAYVGSNASTNNERVRDAAHAILSSPEFVRF